ncbi:CysB family HTH-type transcriptional regulator [Zavarzinia sp.]|uniref:CysB family HTH-type transcriptional regulator n=1 Tax=Zavarzinia sp. TaxID=2027920 RepID=UPI003561EFCA
MNFQQLRIIREAVRQDFNLTEVAATLFTSQSGVSKHIKDLEEELGIDIFVRKGKRLLGLTSPGKEVAAIVERMLLDAQNIKNVARQYAAQDEGQLTVAATHTQARYALPPVVAGFKRAFPKVHLSLHQGGPDEIVRLLIEGKADIGVATEALANMPDLVSFPYYVWHHAVVVPAGHPLETVAEPSLEEIARYPIVTYHEGLTGRARIDEAFAAAGIVPDIVIEAQDADVIKAYVEIGLGIGIMAPAAFDAVRDTGLRLLPGRPFRENVARLAIRRGHFLRSYAYRFIEGCNPDLVEKDLRAAVAALPTRDD